MHDGGEFLPLRFEFREDALPRGVDPDGDDVSMYLDFAPVQVNIPRADFPTGFVGVVITKAGDLPAVREADGFRNDAPVSA